MEMGQREGQWKKKMKDGGRQCGENPNGGEDAGSEAVGQAMDGGSRSGPCVSARAADKNETSRDVSNAVEARTHRGRKRTLSNAIVGEEQNRNPLGKEEINREEPN